MYFMLNNFSEFHPKLIDSRRMKVRRKQRTISGELLKEIKARTKLIKEIFIEMESTLCNLRHLNGFPVLRKVI